MARTQFVVKSMRLIDCDSMDAIAVALLPTPPPYYALSYVWGSSQPKVWINSSAQNPNLGIFGELPQLIQDAMKVVKKLETQGARYLLVDRYCIFQDNPADRVVQIRAMDRIYEDAYAVIVAAAGDGSQCGLPGVDRTERRIQPTATLREIQVLSTLPDVFTALRDTSWITHGWTYQEAIVSRRCLIFTDWQVYFVCEKSICCKSMQKTSDLTIPKN